MIGQSITQDTQVCRRRCDIGYRLGSPLPTRIKTLVMEKVCWGPLHLLGDNCPGWKCSKCWKNSFTFVLHHPLPSQEGRNQANQATPTLHTVMKIKQNS